MLYIRDVLPNPVGKDTDGEWIGIFNSSTESVNLSGFSLSDASGKTFRISKQSIASNQELQFGYGATHITLNNDSDTITLRDPSGKAIDTLSYTGPVSEGEIIYGKEFTPQAPVNQLTASVPLEQLEFTGNKIENLNLHPLLIGFVVALLAGVAIAYFVKRITTEEE